MNSEKAIAVLDALARHLGTTANYLIPIFARRAVGGALAELLAVAVIATIGLKAWRWKPSEESVDDSDGFIYLAKWAPVIAALVFGSILMVDVVQTLASPEAAAIAEILNALHGR